MVGQAAAGFRRRVPHGRLAVHEPTKPSCDSSPSSLPSPYRRSLATTAAAQQTQPSNRGPGGARGTQIQPGESCPPGSTEIRPPELLKTHQPPVARAVGEGETGFARHANHHVVGAQRIAEQSAGAERGGAALKIS